MSVPQITIDELAAKLAEGAPLIDVRRPEEYNRFHVPRAVLIPLADMPERAEEVPSSDTVYVICAVGERSAKAVDYLRRLGIDAVNVAGGSNAWAEAGHPTATGPEPG
jgi:rhodanese-related sulfurtransferase